MTARTLMVQGCTSDAGKSALVTALCRWLRRRGVRVAPFKPQNMALNSAVAANEDKSSGEIGRAQAVQAQACGLAPHSDMNPVLLKPNSDTGCQVIIQGRALSSQPAAGPPQGWLYAPTGGSERQGAWGQNMEAQAYHDYKPRARAAVLDSFARLSSQYDAVVVEGAGSPAEINLRAGDIANMGFAEAVDCPVILVADIDRGGVFAHIVGTLALLSETERARVKGFVINRFRGDLSLLRPGLDWLERETGKPVLGVLPYLHGLHLEAEDALPSAPSEAAGGFRVIVPVLPRISNHTDFDALRLHAQVDFRFVGLNETPPPADLIILPGSKSVRADLAYLREHGWMAHLQRHLRYGGKLLGICGGFQMLGRAIHDPLGLEGQAGSLAGLGWLDMETTLEAEKQLRNVAGRLALGGAAPVSGYEIHAGISSGGALQRPLAWLEENPDGALTEDGQVAGTYLHGLFDTPAAADAVLAWAGLRAGLGTAGAPDIHALRDAAIDRLADAVEAHLDLPRLLELLEPPCDT